MESVHASWSAGNLRKRELQLQEEKRDITILGSDSSDFGSCDSDDGECDDGGEGAMADPSDNLSDESLVEDEGDDLEQDEVNNCGVILDSLFGGGQKRPNVKLHPFPKINCRSPGTCSTTRCGPAAREEPPARGAPGQAEEPAPQRQGFGRQRQQARL